VHESFITLESRRQLTSCFLVMQFFAWFCRLPCGVLVPLRA
jgi:hypothetical protein